MPESYLVIGGSGFLGHRIVEFLLARGETAVAVFDIVQRHFEKDVTFYTGDITVESQISDAIQKSGVTCIIHTASPPHGLGTKVYWHVNVEGTNTIIAAAVANGVRKLVFTSSAGALFDGSELIDCDERMPYPNFTEDLAYNETKAKAEEAVLAANGKNGLLTVAIRPAGIFGPGDRQMFPGFRQVITNGQTGFQIGNNLNLWDVTYVDNVVHAHILAADKLDAPLPPLDEILEASLTPISASTGHHRIPTSAARPLGPAVEITPEAEAAAEAFRSTEPEDRPVTRSKFDPLARSVLDVDPSNNMQVAGQAFFITNGEPVYWWDFVRYSWKHMGHIHHGRKIALPVRIGIWLGTAAEWWAKLVGKEAGLTRFRVQTVSTARWYNIEKARRVLGYAPIVGLEEGIRRAAEWSNQQASPKA